MHLEHSVVENKLRAAPRARTRGSANDFPSGANYSKCAVGRLGTGQWLLRNSGGRTIL